MKFAALFFAACLAPLPGVAQSLKIVSDIAPVGSLVEQVAGASVTLLVEPGVSPHDASLRPSQAQALQDADLVIWMGHGLAPGLERPIEELGANAQVLELLDIDAIEYLPAREEAVFEDDHDDHDGHDDDHKEGDHDDHEDGHHHHGDTDPHAWLSPEHASQWVDAIATLLTQHNPDDAALFSQNASAAKARLAVLSAELANKTKSLSGVRMIAGHDAFQYLEVELDLNVIGSVTGGDGAQASAKRMAQITRLPEADCLILDAAEAGPIAEKTAQLLGLTPIFLDVLAINERPGPTLYGDMMTSIGDALAGCSPR